MEPKVSIIIPVLNGAEHIDDMSSYISQLTYENYEVIVIVDTESKDGTLERLEHIHNDKCTIITVDAPGKLSGSRNIGLKMAKGEFIWFLDVDDHPFPEFLSKLMAIQQQYDADVVACNFIYSVHKNIKFNPSKYDFKTMVFNSEEAIKSRLKEQFPVTSWSKIIRTSVLKDNKIEFESGFCEDIVHTYKILSSSNVICYTDEPLYVYYQHSNSFCGGTPVSDNRAFAEQIAYRRISQLYDKKPPTESFTVSSTLTKIRSSGHMSFKSFLKYAKSDECRKMLKECCSNPVVPEALWYRFLPTTYYIAIQLFFRFYHYRDGRIFTRPSKKRKWKCESDTSNNDKN